MASAVGGGRECNISRVVILRFLVRVILLWSRSAAGIIARTVTNKYFFVKTLVFMTSAGFK